MPRSRQYGRTANPGEPGAAARDNQENSSYAAAMVRIIGTWLDRAQSRRALRELAELDACRLVDIGLSRQDALREASKPFWRQ
jgi:uncharacterized protein YjiS (DUF1127 family)